MIHNFSSHSRINDVWNSGYRAIPSPEVGSDRRSTRQVPMGDATADLVTGGYADHTDHSAMRMMAEEGTTPYILSHTAPEIARSIVKAMNAGDTEQAQALGGRLDALVQDSSDLTMWGSASGVSSAKRSDGTRTPLGTLHYNAQALSTGAWKTNAKVLSELAGLDPTLSTTVYSDFVNYDSPESVNTRKATYVNRYGLPTDTAALLAPRDDSDLKGTWRRDVFQPYFGMMEKAATPVDTETIKAKMRLVDQMFKVADRLQIEDHEGVAEMVRAFMGNPADPTRTASLRSFENCLTNYYIDGATHDYKPAEYASQWSKVSADTAQVLQPRRVVNGNTTADALTDVTSATDVQQMEALLGEMGKSTIGFDRFRPETQALARRVAEERRALGFDLKQAGFGNATHAWAQYAKYLSSGSSADLTPEVREIIQAKNDADVVRTRLGASVPETVLGPDGKEVANPQAQMAPALNEFSFFERDMVQEILPSLTEAFVRSRRNGGDITRDDVARCVSKSDSAVVSELRRQTRTGGENEALSKLTDYFYAKLTGDNTASDGHVLSEASLRNFRDYVNTEIRHTHVVNADGSVVRNALRPPVLPSATANLSFDELSVVQSNPERFVGHMDSAVREDLMDFTTQLKRYKSSLERTGKSEQSSYAAGRKEKTTDLAGTKLLMSLAGKELGLGDKLTNELRDASVVLARVLRGQSDTTERHKDGKWYDTITQEESRQVAKDYQQVLTMCDKLLEPSADDRGSVQYLKRVSLAQDILGQLAPMYAQLQVYDTPTEPVVSPGMSVGYRAPQRSLAKPLDRTQFMEVASKAGEVFAGRVAKAFSDFDNTWQMVHDGSAFQKAQANFADPKLREVIDREFNRVNSDYGRSFLQTAGVTPGDAFDATSVLGYMNAKYVQAKEREYEDRAGQYERSLANDDTRRAWGTVFRNLFDMNNATRTVMEAAVNRAKDLNARYGDMFDVNKFAAMTVSTAREKLGNAGGQDLTSVTRNLLDWVGTQRPYFVLTNAAGQLIPPNLAVYGNGKVQEGLSVGYILADNDEDFVRRTGLSGDKAAELRGQLLANQTVLSARYRDEQELRKVRRLQDTKNESKAAYAE